jgi:RNA polymerase sigma factor (sigma-70 family)
MVDDTVIGGQSDKFPLTRWSAIVAARSDDAAERSRSLEILIAAYWKPVYKYIRMRWRRSNEDAKDLTQGFFTKAMEKGYFDSYDPAKARFRTFLRTCLDAYIANEDKAAQRLKRGGGAPLLSLDFESAEGELRHAEIPDTATMDEYFDREWLRSLFALAIDTLRQECEGRGKSIHFQLFERYDLDETHASKLTYEQLASEFGISASNVTNYLAFARREFRRIVLEKLHEITATDEEFRSEARAVLGVEVGY